MSQNDMTTGQDERTKHLAGAEGAVVRVDNVVAGPEAAANMPPARTKVAVKK